MISGFNTDVEFGGVVYHVQTEDKGLKSRLFVSLVYDHGTILASKRTRMTIGQTVHSTKRNWQSVYSVSIN